jgi:hypothetical protein
VLKPDRTPWTLVIVLHEEVVNQFPGMAYYGGVFSGREVSMSAVEFRTESPFPLVLCTICCGHAIGFLESIFSGNSFCQCSLI